MQGLPIDITFMQADLIWSDCPFNKNSLDVF